VTFSAQVNVAPAASEVAIGETLVVTVSVDVVQGCQFPIYELTLRPSAPVFAYTSPLTHTVGPPVGNPFAYTLTAVEAGTVTFEAVAYGERNCNDYWNWQYLNGGSGPVRVR
jgi:hypothetical protein